MKRTSLFLALVLCAVPLSAQLVRGQSLDYTWVPTVVDMNHDGLDDVIQGTVAAFDYDGPLYDVFNLGENETIQLRDLIAAIENALGKKAKINQLPEQPGDMRMTCADISKARKLLGYNPTTKLGKGLPRFIDWFLSSQRGNSPAL